MSDAGVLVRLRERVQKNWWQLAVTAAILVMGVFAFYEPIVTVFAVVPALLWCWTDRKATVAGVISLGLTAWILLPRDLGFSGPWVPSIFDVCLFLPLITMLVYMTGIRDKRASGCLPAVWLSMFAVAGLLTAGWAVVWYAEGETGDEGVWPGPSGLQIVEGEREGGSGGFNRQLIATGDRAAERMRDYLSGRGFTHPSSSGASICRINGVLVTYKVCAGVVEVSPTTVRVSWRI